MRFSLRFLIVVTAIIAVYCGLVWGVPTAVGLILLSLLTTFIPPLIVGGIIYGRGTARAFWIGCAASGFIPFLVAAFYSFQWSFVRMDGINELGDEGWILTLTMAICHALVFANGLIVVLSKWLYAPKGDRAESNRHYEIIHRRVSLSGSESR